MSYVSGFPYFKVKVAVPLGQVGNYIFPNPIAYLDRGRYLIQFNFAAVASIAGTALSFFNQVALFENSLAGNLLIIAPKTNTNTVDSSGIVIPVGTQVAPPQPCVMYRTIDNTITISANNTPIFLQYLITIGGATWGSSTAPQDDLYNYVHFIKLA
jgi:hypothetical protein